MYCRLPIRIGSARPRSRQDGTIATLGSTGGGEPLCCYRRGSPARFPSIPLSPEGCYRIARRFAGPALAVFDARRTADSSWPSVGHHPFAGRIVFRSCRSCQHQFPVRTFNPLPNLCPILKALPFKYWFSGVLPVRPISEIGFQRF